MANTVTIVTGYTNEHKDELLTKAVLGGKSIKYIDIMPNVKSKDTIPTLDSTVVLADGSVCGWNPQGSDVFGERTIETKAVKIEKEFCYKDFEKTFANYQLLWEAGREKLPFEEKIANSNMGKIQDAVEDLVWKGDNTLGISGLIADIKAESGSTVVLSGETGDTATNYIDAVIAAIPQAALRKGVNVFMSYSIFRKYVAEQNANCCANRSLIDAASEELKYVGDSRVNLVPVIGLEDASNVYIVAAPADAMVYATDVENAENVYRMWFEEKDEKFDFRVIFRAGTALRFPDEVVLLEA